MSETRITVDGNEAVARVAYRLHEVIALYPITPATPMGEWADAWSAEARPNLWGTVPTVVTMQSEGGAAGCVHGALQAGALTTTFTASQGLLLMIPNLYKWVGELLPVVLHVAGRTVATQGLSIFGDHSDAMACRTTGCLILVSCSVQEAGDCAAIAARAALEARLPVLHLMDGFRTSHEVQAIAPLSDDLLQALIPAARIAEHRNRALNPEHPVIRGTAQNPDVAFQAREAANPVYAAAAAHVQEAMERFAVLSGRRYQPYEYSGDAQAERVVLLMGSAADTVAETLEPLCAAGERVGLLTVRLFRPFAATALVAALPPSVRAIAVLDRCKEPGAVGEPLYGDVVAALAEAWPQRHRGLPLPLVLGGRYGLASKDFTPAMVLAVLSHLARALSPSESAPLNHFTVGIDDDLTHSSLPVDPAVCLEGAAAAGDGSLQALVYGLGSDGTVGATKSTVKIIGGATDLHVQSYVVYDSKKSGSVTVSHLRVSPRPIRARYLIQRPTLVACHQWSFLERFDLLNGLVDGGVLLLNAPHPPAETWRRLPPPLRATVRERQLKVWTIDASAVARDAGLGPHINTVMQVCFFAVSGVLPMELAIARIREAITHTYASKGPEVVAANLAAIDATLEQLAPIDWIALEATAPVEPLPRATRSDRWDAAPAFVREVIAPMLALQGDRLPVSALPSDGTWPCGTARWEKRGIAEQVPRWHPDLCVQCGKCLLVCPHAAIRGKVAPPEALAAAPAGFRQAPARDHAFADQAFTIQVAVDDCTGCGLCVAVCPAADPDQLDRRALTMEALRAERERERGWWQFFEQLPEVPRHALHLHKLGQQQLQQPLFEFSGACAGCGETPYLKLVSQLFGDRMLVANATGCSSIYGGNLPTTPWSTNREGRGPAWSNSLFEDNAEFGFGMRLAVDQQRQMALELLAGLAGVTIPAALAAAIAADEQTDEPAIFRQRERVEELKRLLRATLTHETAEQASASPVGRLLTVADALVKRSVWLVGGDGWAYDIGFGGLDHVLASGRDVNVLVLDTEVYSNTGGQMSKATPLGAVAKFAAAGKATPKKDLGLMAITYGSVYVASVAMGARDEHTVRAFLEAEAFPGPSLILAYAHCIAHGIAMGCGMEQQRLAVESGRWLLYRYDPRRRTRGESPLRLDSSAPRQSLLEAMASEQRFRQLSAEQLQRAAAAAEVERQRRWELFKALAAT
jgi:pyruvate-ferredoxin/flavodoxin oxidoreductase